MQEAYAQPRSTPKALGDKPSSVQCDLETDLSHRCGGPVIKDSVTKIVGYKRSLVCFVTVRGVFDFYRGINIGGFLPPRSAARPQPRS
ncbi:hypothetical protein EVAR_95942_1 [Eumeta japonica]|uniref:Uncharacterized protein n=1 Tax=Eumeta variegata TaxID=151549 RepID=A0A4C1V7I7_EUMVA|nr:hypothetical protein EVAR_95942_1 [Eumeta japonica]